MADPSAAGTAAVSPISCRSRALRRRRFSAESASGGAPRSSSCHSTSALRRTISSCASSQREKRGSPDAVMPATCSTPSASRRTCTRRSSIASPCTFSSPRSSALQASRFSTAGRVRTSRPALSCKRTSESRTCGLSPNQRTSIPPIATGWPTAAETAATMRPRWRSMSGSSQNRAASTMAAAAKNKAQARNSSPRRARFMVEWMFTLVCSAHFNPQMPDPIGTLSDSRYALRVLAARPELSAELGAEHVTPARFSREEMAQALAGAERDDEAALMRRLRRLRERVLLRVMARDLCGLADLEEVCDTMSDLAELAIAAALEEKDLIVVAMGKLGGRELNVSSDIDLIFVHPGALEDQERYERAGRRLIRLLAAPTEDGLVFRVDMRLRPYGDSGPLACSFDFLETYFITQGREWERYAWIKARALTGTAGEELSKIVRPFVFRKYLDYATLGAMRQLHAEVRREVARRELAGHVKLGPGGIREIEFVAQALQLVRGGRDPELAVRPTLQVLENLGARRLLPDSAVNELSRAYVFLRNLEHRLQYLDDAQRHDLPQQAEEQARVARMCGFASWETFSGVLQAHRDAVSRHFEAVFGESAPASEPWPDHPRLASLRASQRYAGLPAESRRRLDALVPPLVRAAAATSDAETTLARALDLVEAIASRAAYLALLAEHPEALERVTRILGASSWAAEFVTRHPLLLDELLDDRLLYAPPDLDAYARG